MKAENLSSGISGDNGEQRRFPFRLQRIGGGRTESREVRDLGERKGRDPFNAEGALRFWQNWFAAFSSFDWEMTRSIAAEDIVVVEWTFIGKQDGPLDGLFRFSVLVSNKVARLRGASFFECKDGQIVYLTLYMDLATLMVELGISP